jgi:hypothetical protein
MKASTLVCVVLAFAACKKDKWENAVVELEGFRDQMCGCKDKSGDRMIQKSCADDVSGKMEAWRKDMKSKFGEKETPPEALITRGDKAEKELRECKKAITAASGAAQAEMVVGDMVKFKDRMCACKDKACADGVTSDMQKWGVEQAKNTGEAPTPETTKKLGELADALTDCQTKAMPRSE